MPATKRLQRLTTFYLAALYGVVGLTGGSLHYLVTDWASFWSSSDSVETVVYFHVHAPDHQGHFHRHTVHVHHHGDAKVASNRDASQSKGPTAKSPDSTTHQQHACPLLRIVSTLKVLPIGGTAHVSLNVVSTFTIEAELLFTPEFLRDTYARGPPSDNLA